MKLYRLVILCALIATLVPATVRAQYDVVFSHYFDMQTSFNPAAAGKDSKLNVGIAYASQLSGYEHNPQTAYLAGDLPIKGLGGRNGLGVVFYNDKLGLFTHQRIEAQYAYHKKMGKGSFGIGIQAGLLSEKFTSSDLDLEDSNDPAFAKSDVDGNVLDMGAGLLLRFPKWYLGLSAQHITFPTVELGEYNEMEIGGIFFLSGGYDFQLPNPTLKLATSMLVRSDLVAYRGDLTLRMIYSHEGKMMYAGLGYSPLNSVSVYVGGKFHDILLGYSYEAYTGGIGMLHGSHEIRIGYQTDIDLGKKGRNKHQSVRYL